MKRIRCDLIFAKTSDANTVWQALKNYAKNVKLKSLVGEKGFIDYHECHHDESPRGLAILRRTSTEGYRWDFSIRLTYLLPKE